jgi:hypothetical protein
MASELHDPDDHDALTRTGLLKARGYSTEVIAGNGHARACPTCGGPLPEGRAYCSKLCQSKAGAAAAKAKCSGP